MSQDSHVSLAELQSAGLRLRPFEAATIARAVAQQVLRGDIPGIPSVQVIRLARDGRILIEGPVEAGGRAVPRAAQLLDDLLPGFDAPPEVRAPGALRLVVARGLHTLDLPAYPSLQSFVEALTRFASPDSAPVVRDLLTSSRDLLESWDEAQAQSAIAAAAPPLGEPPPAAEPAASPATLTRMEPVSGALTISDIRRARRATGLTLGDIATRSRIPAWLLRELEWGYFRNWPAGHYGRTQLVRYARAAGLDDQIVARTVWPLVEREARTEGRAVVPAMEWTESPEWDERVMGPSDAPIDVEIEEIEVLPHAVAPPPRAAWRRRALAALAIPALLALALLPIDWQGLGLDWPALDRSAAPVRTPSAAIEAPASLPENLPRTDVPAPPAGPAPSEAEQAPRDAVQASRDAAPAEGVEGPAPALGDASGYSPAFSAVGTAMFYHTGSDGQSALMRADADSRGAVLRVTSVVDDNAANFHPRPSPDGSRIAFDSDREGVRAVYVADAEGQNVRRVSGEGFAAIPSWSPDGRLLAYVRAEPDRPRVWNIWVTDLDSGDSRRVTSYRVGQPWGASWFPDGKRIAYSHETRLVVRTWRPAGKRSTSRRSGAVSSARRPCRPTGAGSCSRSTATGRGSSTCPTGRCGRS
jgi:hypothetical protein